MTSTLLGKIMIVDDDAMNREVMEAFLTFEHFDVVAVKDGWLALEKIEQEKPNLVMLDLRMPDMDGIELCRQIKSQYAIPVFIITGMDTLKERSESKAAGADEFISRPFEVETLIHRIKAYLLY
ncbi:response regulator [Phototrophicus methaneseepsis]|uniref:Response regulator n=1 Tax=Phototrophicus methaneseepsis TaxID=2710758 RepID=A0A7S8EDK6_9CHLR|nr:response regulator [Phototrophicus methaneseepsis]QPC85023.1 response regulator [Phototrophicus methaneseepsis]